YTEKNGLSFHDITALNEDTSGNVWLGTNSAGLMKFERNGFITYDQRDGLYMVNAIFGSRMGAVCFRGAILGDGHKTVFEGAKADLFGRALDHRYTRLGQFDGRSFTWFNPKIISDFGWLMEGITLQSHTGEWWVGANNAIYRFPPSYSFAAVATATPLAVYRTKEFGSDQLFRLFEDSDGDLWVSNMSGKALIRWDRAHQILEDLTTMSGLSSHPDLARSFSEDRSGNIWIGFNSRLARYRNGAFTFFTTNEGLPSGAITSIYLDHAGRLWLASARSGLIRIDETNVERPHFINYTTAQGLSSNSTEIFADQLITEDLQGHIYIGTSRGLDRLDPPTGHIRHFTTADGLAAGSIKAAFCDHTGVLWFGTSRGLSKFVPAPEESAPAPPPILISDMRIAGSSEFISALGETEIVLPDLGADQNQLQINFVGLSFATGDVLRYQFKLEGAETDWSTPGDQRNVSYARLAPGRYRFLVRAVNSDGVASARPAFIAFRILPPLWRRWWFLTAVAAGLIFLLYRLYRYRVASLLELERVRTRIAIDLHDDIGSNLSLIAGVSDGLREELQRGNGKIAERLSLIANVSHRSVDAMSDIVWAVNPEKDHLVDLTQRMRRFASDAFVARHINFEFSKPEVDHDHNLKIRSDLRRELFLIFKESVNNAVRHSGCSKADICLQILGSKIVLQICDNGFGFDPALINDGNGLVSMRCRAAAIGGALQIVSRPGAGTTVLLTAPLKSTKESRDTIRPGSFRKRL
ncbi:MAG TPA: two-component regulator propeller domain-containing protein, partial [Pyrinomonadaceae bacterium]